MHRIHVLSKRCIHVQIIPLYRIPMYCSTGASPREEIRTNNICFTSVLIFTSTETIFKQNCLIIECQAALQPIVVCLSAQHLGMQPCRDDKHDREAYDYTRTYAVIQIKGNAFIIYIYCKTSILTSPKRVTQLVWMVLQGICATIIQQG